MTGLASLRNFVRKPPEMERCDLCSAGLSQRHQHLVDPAGHKLICSCDACAILFASDGQTRYRRVPRDTWYLGDRAVSDQCWNSLGIPIGLAFLYRSSPAKQVTAVYPSPAGPTEVAVDDESWQQIVSETPSVANLAEDVEALLVNRLRRAKDCFRAPIDECYRLTGIVRKCWRGFSGGEEGWEQIQLFFDDLKSRALYAGPVV